MIKYSMPCAGDQIAEWCLHSQIGQGSFATVWKATSRVTGIDVAIKVISLKSLTYKLRECLKREVEALFKIRHENVLELYDTIEHENEMYLITEYCANGDLSSLCQSTAKVTDALRLQIVQQLLNGLSHLHACGYIHRDLKPRNILLDKNGTVKIADFGFARPLQTQDLAETLCGSPMYMAPEIMLHQKYSAKADVWSLGVLVYEMFCGRPPFPGASCPDLLRLIRRDWEHIVFPETLSGQLKEALCHMLQPRPERRASASDLSQYDIFRMVAKSSSSSVDSLIFEFSDSMLVTDDIRTRTDEIYRTSSDGDFVFIESEICKERQLHSDTSSQKITQKRSSQLLSSFLSGMSPLLRRWSLSCTKQI